MLYSTTEVQQYQNGACNLDLEIRVKFRWHEMSVGTRRFTRPHQLVGFLFIVAFQLKTLIVYGERDTSAPVDTLKKFPNSSVAMMRDAGHACYMNNKSEWHELMYEFLSKIDA